MTDPGPKPRVFYRHLYVGDDGVSRFAQCSLTNYELKGVGPADPQWNDKHGKHPSTVVFTVQPVGWVGDWHENPAPQWIVVLSGRWFIESMDGARIEQGPGEFSFGEDQGCTETDGKKGHRSGTVGDVPCALMTVQLHVKPSRTPATSGDLVEGVTICDERFRSMVLSNAPVETLAEGFGWLEGPVWLPTKTASM